MLKFDFWYIEYWWKQSAKVEIILNIDYRILNIDVNYNDGNRKQSATVDGILNIECWWK